MSLLVLTSVLLMTKVLNIAELLFEKGVGFNTTISIIGSMALYLTGITLPLAFLMGMLMCFGRLTSDNEMIALRTSGISIAKISFPALILSLILSAAAFFMHFSILPSINWKASMAVHNLAQNATQLLEEGCWMKGFGKSSIFIQKIEDDNSFKGVEIQQPLKDISLPRIIIAKEGYYRYEEENNTIYFDLIDGYIDEPSPDNDKSFERITFGEYTVKLNVTRKVFNTPPKRTYHLNFNELEQRIKETSKDETEYRYLVYEKHNRITLSLACFVFLLVGIPVSLQFKRSEKSVNFMFAGALALGWYLIMLFGRALSLGEHIPIVFGSWLPNIIIGTLGLILSIKKIRE